MILLFFLFVVVEGTGFASGADVVGPIFLEAAETAFGAEFGGGAEAVDEEDAVEVVDFVLESAGEESVGFDGLGFAVEGFDGDGDVVGAADFVAQARDAEAAFVVEIFVFTEAEFGVEEDDGHGVCEGAIFAVDAQVTGGFWVV